MTKQTKPKAKHKKFSAEWYYNQLMAGIEPDLTIENISTLDQKYAGETAEEREARMGQYAAAFIILEDAMQQLTHEMQIDADVIKEEIKKEAMQNVRAQEAKEIDDIEGSIQGFPSAA